MKHRRAHKRRQKETAELNITAFMNLMVILVPFLLITAVFSRLAVLELNLPGAQAEAEAEPPEPVFALEITIREDQIEVGDRNQGLLSLIENSGESYDLVALSDYLQRVKREFPDKSDATVLLEPDISYEVLVEVMDAVRVAELVDDTSREVVRYELFPEISIGDAPILN
jgi:biopolymer transport protein ExbD